MLSEDDEDGSVVAQGFSRAGVQEPRAGRGDGRVRDRPGEAARLWVLSAELTGVDAFAG